LGDRVFGRLDAEQVWADLARARINYRVDEIRHPEWDIDTHGSALPGERPGAPVPNGSWERACLLVRGYEFSPPEIVRALYDPAAALLGRDMLLEARFHGMHFYCGVRVTEVVDQTRDNGDRVWGWAYETLEGHLERGKVSYEVVKYQDTGRVAFVTRSSWQVAPTLDRITSLGWRMYGRRTRLRFYRRCGERLHAFVAAGLRGDSVLLRSPARAGHLVLAPADAPIRRRDALAIHRIAPGC
jgi:uncharacterized protein (UPF0548 family)